LSDPGYTADACSREAAWLNTVDGVLPSLPASAGGPWQFIGAYTQAAATRTQLPAIYVTRGNVQQIRVANQRVRPRYPMKLELHWPVRATTPGTSTSIAAAEAQNFDDAIELLRQRVTGPLGDKSHGGRFLSAAISAKGSPDIDVAYEKASETIPQAKELRACMSYWVDDYELNI
jgi:hypothetical protein